MGRRTRQRNSFARSDGCGRPMKPLIEQHLIPGEKHFRWRGGEITRLEAFTDAVFAFAVTLLVVSLEVPRTFTELLTAMKGFVAFAICFAILVQVWYEHYIFSRRYGLQTLYTVFLNSVLIFVVLFFVYPLKFLFCLVVGGISGGLLATHPLEETIQPSQVPALMVITAWDFLPSLWCLPCCIDMLTACAKNWA